MKNGDLSKHQRIYHDLKSSIAKGDYNEGDRLPTEAALAERFRVSRPTVTKALNNLKREGIITRRAGSGSYVARRDGGPARHRLFGLLIPSLGKGEIFEPICAQIAALSEDNDFSLLWSGSELAASGGGTSLEQIARRYVENRVAGVFFAPLELRPEFESVNQKVIAILERAEIPTVLIDTDYLPFPQRSAYDLVGIDNFRSGYLLTDHLLEHGYLRVDFLSRPHSSYTVAIRARGCRAALLDRGIEPDASWVHLGDPGDPEFVKRELLGLGAENVVCGNDETAAALMHTLERLSVPIPERIRVVGFDDVRYSQHLRVPLTTLRQPCQELGTVAVDTMLGRLEHPERAPRTIAVAGTIVLRKSCGHHSE